VKRHKIHQMNLVALVRKPGCIDAGTAANVEDGGGSGGKEAPEKFLGPGELDA
jgi:hypothetical protein